MKNSHRTPYVLIALLALSWLTACCRVFADESATLEYEVKAAYLFNFGKFVSWPETAFANESAPFVIGVLGDNPFRDDLKKMIDGKNIDGHPMVFRQFASAEAVRNCNILFVSEPVQKDTPAILAALRGAPVLTVTENLPQFASSGFAISFVKVQANIRFEINRPAATQAGLTVSSKLMSLALRQDP